MNDDRGMMSHRPRITGPLLGERTSDGSKLMRRLRHKKLRSHMVMSGASVLGKQKPWQCKLIRNVG